MPDNTQPTITMSRGGVLIQRGIETTFVPVRHITGVSISEYTLEIGNTDPGFGIKIVGKVEDEIRGYYDDLVRILKESR